MGKKYLSIEEAANLLGMEPKELNRLREKGDVRAFADRGTWKFRQDEIEELSRTRQADSNPEVPLGDYADPRDLSSDVFFEETNETPSDSAIVLGRDEEGLGDQPTVIRKNPLDIEEADSDVRLIIDDKFQPASGSGVQKRGDSGPKLKTDDPDSSSDSDVKVVKKGSDSDVKLVKKPGEHGGMGQGSDSDVKLVPDKDSLKAGSDSDVKLVTPGKGSKAPLLDSGSDSDVALVAPGKPAARPPEEEEGLSLDFGSHADDPSDGSFVLGGESGIMLSGPSDSGISLDTGDSGIALDLEDSGIALDDGGSGISLQEDSGISLAGDSGISLSGPSDSGIGLETPGGSTKLKKGRKPPEQDDLGGTIPMMPTYPLQPEEKLGDTQMEVPLLGGSHDSDFEFSSNTLDDDTTNVIMLDDDSADDHSATMVKKGRGPTKEESLDDSVFEADDSDTFAAAPESGAYEVSDSDLEVSDDVLGEDDELDDVFGADDEDFDEGLQTGQSHAELIAPMGGRMSHPVEVEWGTDVFAGLTVATLLMCITGWVTFDLVRTMWSGNPPLGPSNTLLQMVSGFFG